MSKAEKKELQLPDLKGNNCFKLRTANRVLTIATVAMKAEASFRMTKEEVLELIDVLLMCNPDGFDNEADMPESIKFRRDDRELQVGPYCHCLGVSITSNRDKNGHWLYSWAEIHWKSLEPLLSFLREWILDLEFDREKEQLAPVFGLSLPSTQHPATRAEVVLA